MNWKTFHDINFVNLDYRPFNASNWPLTDSGLLGLPITRPGRAGVRQLTEDAAAVTFLRYQGGRFRGLGELGSRPESAVSDACVASCVDWYGNARPIFLRGRILALMGYELVEGSIDNEAIHETAHADFTPVKGR